MKPIMQVAAFAVAVAAGTQYTIVDAQGRVVGSIVTDTPVNQLRVIGVTSAGRITTAPQPDPGADRAFHPDYTKALSAEQLSRAWQAELDRLAPPLVTGGG